MPFFGYEYFCGANVVVEIESFPILEAAGLQYNIMETKRPIYGYSSRHFDAVARGQVIVEGSLIVNYVHQDYLFRAIEQGLIDQGLSTAEDAPEFTVSNELSDQLVNELEASRISTNLLANYEENVELAQAFRDKWWSTPDTPENTDNSFLPNPHDSFGGMDIRVTFGRRNETTGYLGDTGLLLSDVYFTGRGLPIQIDQNVIVEEYPFFARNVYSLQQPYAVIEESAELLAGRGRATTGGKTGDTINTVVPIIS